MFAVASGSPSHSLLVGVFQMQLWSQCDLWKIISHKNLKLSLSPLSSSLCMVWLMTALENIFPPHRFAKGVLKRHSRDFLCSHPRISPFMFPLFTFPRIAISLCAASGLMRTRDWVLGAHIRGSVKHNAEPLKDLRGPTKLPCREILTHKFPFGSCQSLRWAD